MGKNITGDIIRNIIDDLTVRHLSIAATSRREKISEKVVRNVIQLCKDNNISILQGSISFREFEKMYSNVLLKKRGNVKVIPNFEELYLDNPSGSVQQLYLDYLDHTPKNHYARSTFYQLHKEYMLKARNNITPHMPIDRAPGDETEVDWCGKTYDVLVDGEIRTAYIFVGVLSYSGYVYAEAVLERTLKSFISCHVNMFYFFDGVTKFLICDNWKEIVKIRGNEKLIAPSYLLLAKHFGTLIRPARISKPRDKPIVESSVNQIQKALTRIYVKGMSYSDFCEQLDFSMKKLNDATFSKHDYSRSDRYKLELASLHKLRIGPKYKYEEAARVRVSRNSCVEWKDNYYNVHPSYIGHELIVVETEDTIRILDQNLSLVAGHSKFSDHIGRKSIRTEYIDSTYLPELERRHKEGYGI